VVRTVTSETGGAEAATTAAAARRADAGAAHGDQWLLAKRGFAWWQERAVVNARTSAIGVERSRPVVQQPLGPDFKVTTEGVFVSPGSPRRASFLQRKPAHRYQRCSLLPCCAPTTTREGPTRPSGVVKETSVGEDLAVNRMPRQIRGKLRDSFWA
jgi:hypothetical protein